MEAPKNIPDFIKKLKETKNLKHITEEVDPYLEITALTEPIMKKKGPALLFENIKGYSSSIIINLFGSKDRMSMALGVKEISEISKRIKKLLQINISENFFGKIVNTLPKIKEFANFIPKRLKKAPCQEIKLLNEKADLDILPILTCWPLDAGPFLTLTQVITADPETKIQNSGMYRLQYFNKKNTGLHWHLHKGGAKHYNKAKKRKTKLPVSIALGGPPAAIYAASAPLPPNIDEFMFSGFLMKNPLKVVKCITNDLLVPAESEIILEGYTDPNEAWRIEGPFGDHTGYYSLADKYPVFHLTAITHRENFIYPTTIVGKPPMEDFYLGLTTERIFLPLLQLIIPEIVDYHMPSEGVFHNLVFVSIKKEYPGHAYKVMNALWGQGQMMFAKIIVIVDQDVDVQNSQETWWEALNHIDPARDIIFTKGPADVLDHATNTPCFHSKMGIDGTRKWQTEGSFSKWPNPIKMDKKLQEKALEKLKKWKLI